MKKKHLVITSVLFLSCLIIFSCRRDLENLINDQVVPSASLESARIWHAQHVKTSVNRLRPQWRDSWMLKTSSGEVLVVPAPEKRVTSRDHSIRRVFVFTFSGSQVSNGMIMEFLGKKYNASDNLDKLISSADKGTIVGFNGVVFKYDVNYMQLSSAVFENGAKIEAKADLISEKGMTFAGVALASKNLRTMSLNTPRTSSVTPTYQGWPADIGPDCTVTYTRVEYYTNGVLTGVVLEFVSMSCPTGAGSGESGGGGSSGGESNGGSGDNPDYGGPPETGGNTNPPTTPPPSAKDPCNEVNLLNAVNRSVNLRNAVTTIKNQTASSQHEWGSAVNYSSGPGLLENNISVTTPTTSGQPLHWEGPAFEWDDANNLHTRGYIHSHLADGPPSITDVLMISRNALSHSFLNNPTGLAEYQLNAFVTTVTGSGNYTVTIKKWDGNSGVMDRLTDYETHPASFHTAYNNAREDYLLNENNLINARIFALNEVFPGMLNIYRSDALTPNVYKPVKVGRDNENNGEVSIKGCP